jgi:hypothetical protein
MCAELPHPTSKQIDAFVDDALVNNSGNRHLPMAPPGAQFFFFLSPTAACKIDYRRNGEATVRSVKSIHDQKNPQATAAVGSGTAGYRQNYGYLWWSIGDRCPPWWGVRFGGTDNNRKDLSNGFRAPDYCWLPKIACQSKAIRIPPEIAEAGCCELTGVISFLASQGLRQNPEGKFGGFGEMPDWPDETGGQDTLDAIMELLHRPRVDDATDSLDQFMQPERQRLKSVAKDAIQRMLTMVYG